MLITSSLNSAASCCKGHDKETGIKPLWVWPSVSILNIVFLSSLDKMDSRNLPWTPKASYNLTYVFWSFYCWGFTFCCIIQGCKRRAILFTLSSKIFLHFVFIIFLKVKGNAQITIFLLFLSSFFFLAAQEDDTLFYCENHIYSLNKF